MWKKAGIVLNVFLITLAGPSAGVADAFYDDLFTSSGTPITANGLFFSAQFTAMSVGTGTFAFTDLSGFQGFNPVTVVNGTPDGLAYTITEQVSPAPAPSSLLLAGVGVALLGLLRLRRRVTSCFSSL
jgi:MYXO-CTERM domain-containing protein